MIISPQELYTAAQWAPLLIYLGEHVDPEIYTTCRLKRDTATIQFKNAQNMAISVMFSAAELQSALSNDWFKSRVEKALKLLRQA